MTALWFCGTGARGPAGRAKKKSAKVEIVQEITVWQHSPDSFGIMAAHLKKSVVTVVDK